MDDPAVEVLYVVDPVGKGGDRSTKAAWWDMWYEDLEDRADELLDEAREIAEELGGSVETGVRYGKPSEEIIAYSEEDGFDGIVMGRQGETGLSRVLLGSVADNVSRHSDLPVTLVGETN